jgi:putative sigma-54 modulation protein
MKFEYTGRHVEVSPAIRRHVEDHFKKLDHIFNGDSTLKHSCNYRCRKEPADRRDNRYWREHTLTAKDTNADMYMALTRAMAKIEKQASNSRRRSSIENRVRSRGVAPQPDGHLEATPRPPRIIPARRYAVKPMTAEEAALRLSGETDQFLVFRDADTSSAGSYLQTQTATTA